jgi:hypothetical protein
LIPHWKTSSAKIADELNGQRPASGKRSAPIARPAPGRGFADKGRIKPAGKAQTPGKGELKLMATISLL